jgi:hypothetical protein
MDGASGKASFVWRAQELNRYRASRAFVTQLAAHCRIGVTGDLIRHGWEWNTLVWFADGQSAQSESL